VQIALSIKIHRHPLFRCESKLEDDELCLNSIIGNPLHWRTVNVLFPYLLRLLNRKVEISPDLDDLIIGHGMMTETRSCTGCACTVIVSAHLWKLTHVTSQILQQQSLTALLVVPLLHIPLTTVPRIYRYFQPWQSPPLQTTQRPWTRSGHSRELSPSISKLRRRTRQINCMARRCLSPAEYLALAKQL
jgi:hypothetical protein